MLTRRSSYPRTVRTQIIRTQLGRFVPMQLPSFLFQTVFLNRLSRVFEIKYQNLVFPSEIVRKLDSLNNTPEFQVPVILLVCFMMLSNYGHTHRSQQFELTYVVKCGCYVISSFRKTSSDYFTNCNIYLILKTFLTTPA